MQLILLDLLTILFASKLAGRASHNEGRVHCGNIGIYQAWECKTLRWSISGTWIAIQQTRPVVRYRWNSRPHLVQWPPPFATFHEEVSQTMGRVLESLSWHQKAGSETCTRKAPMSPGRSGTTLWSSRVHLQVTFCCGYQQQCLDTGKLGVVSWLDAQ